MCDSVLGPIRQKRLFFKVNVRKIRPHSLHINIEKATIFPNLAKQLPETGGMVSITKANQDWNLS